MSSVFILAAVWRHGKIADLARIAGAGVLGAALSAIYWVPALGLLDTVSPESLANFRWQEAFFPLDPLAWSAWDMRLWSPFVGLSVLSLGLIVVGRHTGTTAGRTILALLLPVWLLVLPISWLVWAHTPLQVVQFPWRFLMIADIAFALAAAMLVVSLDTAMAGRRTALRVLGMLMAVSIVVPLSMRAQTQMPPFVYP